MSPELLPQHRALLEASAIAKEVAAARGYFSATQPAQLVALGFRPYQSIVPALVVPIRDTSGEVALHQIRPDRPRVTDAGKELKYETPAGTRLCIDVPPAAREQLADPKVPLWITEGARKADAAVSASLCCVSLLGVWGWRGTNEQDGKTALADWESIALNDRAVFLAFDSDVMTKDAVTLALAGLRRFLAKRGARVRCIYLPSERGEKVGLDDFLASGRSVDDLLACADSVRQPEQPQKPPTKIELEVNELVEFVIGQLLPFPNDGTVSQLFHTPAGEPYSVVAPNNVMQTLSVRSSAFRNFLAASFYQQKQKAPSSEALAQARYVLEGKALFEGPEVDVFTRIGRGRDGAVYLDLCDEKWRAVRIDAAGWNVVTKSPVRFRRAGGMLALPVPQRGGSLGDLREFVNVTSDADFYLLVGFLLGAIRAAGPYLVLVLQGQQGSAKSSVSRALRRLIDPNKAELRAQPKEPRDLAIACNNAWVINLDNLSSVPDWLSDGLCRVATGGGFATRRLFSDDDEAIFDAQRPVILNGIDSVAERGDLLDRAILLSLPRLQKVIPEDVFWRNFEAARPMLLGALLDAASMALRYEQQVRLEASVRMADAARWVVAAEPVLPWEPGSFLTAYVANRAGANETVVEASPVAVELLMMMKVVIEFEGTAGDLLAELNRRTPEKITKLKTWPRTPRKLRSDLVRVAPSLRALGVQIEFPGEQDRTGHARRREYRVFYDGVGNRPAALSAPPTSMESGEASPGFEAEDADGPAADAGGYAEPSADGHEDRSHVSYRKGSGKSDADDAAGSVPAPRDAVEAEVVEW